MKPTADTTKSETCGKAAFWGALAAVATIALLVVWAAAGLTASAGRIESARGKDALAIEASLAGLSSEFAPHEQASFEDLVQREPSLVLNLCTSSLEPCGPVTAESLRSTGVNP